MKLSINQISFLKDVLPSIKIDMSSGWRFHHFDDLSGYDIISFLTEINDDKIYLLIPLFNTSRSPSKATLNLSEPFLVNNKSNPDLITKFIIEQWNSSGFELKQDSKIYFTFKFKRVWFYS